MKNPRVQLAVGIAISVLFLYLAMRGVNPRDLWMALTQFNWWWSIPFVALTLLSMWVRAWRWHYFLLPTANLPTRKLWDPLMAGFAINGLLPARIGEFARAFVLARQEKLPFPRVFGTIVVERIFDTLVLLGLLAYVFSTLEIDPNLSYPYSTRGEMNKWIPAVVLVAIGAGLFLWGQRARQRSAQDGSSSRLASVLTPLGVVLALGGVLVAWLAPAVIGYGADYEINGEALKSLSTKVATLSVIMLVGAAMLVWPAACRVIHTIIARFPLLPDGLRRFASSIVTTFSEGMQSLRSPRLIAIVTVQSLMVWMLVAWSMQIMPYGFANMRAMSISEATALMVITCLAILIPAAPGYWGLMELGIKFGMVILAVDTDPNRVLAYALIVHALQYFPITGIGLLSLWKSQISMTEIRNEKPGASG